MMISPSVIAQAATYRKAFQAAQPFRHVCIDDFFVNAAAEASLRDFPPFDREFAINEYGEVGGKAVVSNIRAISPFYAKLYEYLNSPEFMAAMSAVTDQKELCAKYKAPAPPANTTLASRALSTSAPNARNTAASAITTDAR